MSDDKLAGRINRAHRAAALLNDELFKSAMIELEADYLKQWKAEKKSTDQREMLWHSVATLESVRRKLNAWLDDGKMAQRQLDEMKQRQK
jgi:hypothetical protein